MGLTDSRDWQQSQRFSLFSLIGTIGSILQIDLTDTTGRVCTRMRSYCARAAYTLFRGVRDCEVRGATEQPDSTGASLRSKHHLAAGGFAVRAGADTG